MEFSRKNKNNYEIGLIFFLNLKISSEVWLVDGKQILTDKHKKNFIILALINRIVGNLFDLRKKRNKTQIKKEIYFGNIFFFSSFILVVFV